MVTPRARATASSSACVTPYLIAAWSGSPSTTRPSISDATSRNVVMLPPAQQRRDVALDRGRWPVPRETPVRVPRHPSTAPRRSRHAPPDRRLRSSRTDTASPGWRIVRNPGVTGAPLYVNPSCIAPARIAAWSSAKNPVRTGTVRTSAISWELLAAGWRDTVETSASVAGATTAASHTGGDLFSGGHVEPMAHEQQRCLVLLSVVARDAVDGDDDVVVVEHCVARRRTRHIPPWCSRRSPRS